MPDGTKAYTRDGAFKTTADGRWTTSDGMVLQGGFQPVPTGTTSITISANGEVSMAWHWRDPEFQGATGAFSQSGRSGKHGEKICSKKPMHRVRRKWAIPVKTVLASWPKAIWNVQCEGRRGNGELDHGPARLRSELEGGSICGRDDAVEAITCAVNEASISIW